MILDAPVPGVLTEVLPDVHRLTARNASLMTGPGTNTYLVGRSSLVVIDPGPADHGHVEATAVAASELGRVSAIVVTHTHSDHAPGATELAALTGAPVLGFGSRDGLVVDRALRDGDILDEGDVALTALHTPGHASNHLCYLSVLSTERVLFTGDHIMGGSTVVIAPPDGDMTQYMTSLRRVASLQPPASVIAPGHGPLLPDPESVVEGYLAHRRVREKAVLSALQSLPDASLDDVVTAVYRDVAVELHPIARYSVWAHLLKLRAEGLADSDTPDDVDSLWRALPQEG